MKLTEIPNYLTGIKLRKKSFATTKYIYFDGVQFLSDKGGIWIKSADAKHDDWEVFHEKKRYWRWLINAGGWYKTPQYRDEAGWDTDGHGYYSNLPWENSEKTKCENDFIDV